MARTRSRVVVLALLLWLYVVVQADNNGEGGEGPGDDDRQFSPLYFLKVEPGLTVGIAIGVGATIAFLALVVYWPWPRMRHSDD